MIMRAQPSILYPYGGARRGETRRSGTWYSVAAKQALMGLKFPLIRIIIFVSLQFHKFFFKFFTLSEIEVCLGKY